MITALVVLALALLVAIAYITHGLLGRRFSRNTAFERVWDGSEPVAIDARLDFRTWVARFGKGWVS